MNDQAVATNPFQNAVTVATPKSGGLSTSGQAEVQRAIAEVQAAILLAKQFPRDRVQAYERIINECCREGLAQVAMYSYARGGSEITGPSIRLAEAIACAWGNIQAGWKEVSRQNGVSEVEAWAWDVETNVRWPLSFHVKHVRNTKKGSYALEDERDIYELCANQAARRLRACILRAIPGDVIEAAVKQCEATLNSKITVTPERIAGMVDAFKAFGVSKDMLEKRVQRRVDTINGPQLVQLTKIYNSLKDGMSVAADWFDTQEVAAGEKPIGATEAIKEKLRKGKAGGDAERHSPRHDHETGEVNAEAASPKQAAVASTPADGTRPAPKAIPMPTVAGDTTTPDVAAWSAAWEEAVASAPDADWLRQFRKVNEPPLGSFAKRDPDKHAACVNFYDEMLDELAGGNKAA